jgi:hypothetical protein
MDCVVYNIAKMFFTMIPVSVCTAVRQAMFKSKQVGDNRIAVTFLHNRDVSGGICTERPIFKMFTSTLVWIHPNGRIMDPSVHQHSTFKPFDLEPGDEENNPPRVPLRRHIEFVSSKSEACSVRIATGY